MASSHSLAFCVHVSTVYGRFNSSSLSSLTQRQRTVLHASSSVAHRKGGGGGRKARQDKSRWLPERDDEMVRRRVG